MNNREYLHNKLFTLNIFAVFFNLEDKVLKTHNLYFLLYNSIYLYTLFNAGSVTKNVLLLGDSRISLISRPYYTHILYQIYDQ